MSSLRTHKHNRAQRRSSSKATPHRPWSLRAYEWTCLAVCAAQATALVYFKRVYLTQSVLVADPFRTLLTCLYIAGKVRSGVQRTHIITCLLYLYLY